MQIKDQIGNWIEISETPKRIVCLVPSLTELLVDLGLENQIVGLTKFCIHPNEFKKTKTIIGGTKNVHFDKLSRLEPDFILCNKEENTQEIVENCKKIGTTFVSDIYTIEDTYDLIYQLGNIFSCENKSSELVQIIQRTHTDFLKFIKNKKKIPVAYFIWKDPWMVAGNQTFINYLLKINHFENVFEQSARYPEIAIKDAKELRDAEILFLSSEPFPFSEKHIKTLEIITERRILLVDGEYFSWYGSRLVKAFEYFKELRTIIEG